MSDPTGHVFHDLIEGIIIWDGSDKALSSPPIDVPSEAGDLIETHPGHDHVDPMQDPPEHTAPNFELQAADSGDDVIVAAADHSHDATAVGHDADGGSAE